MKRFVFAFIVAAVLALLPGVVQGSNVRLIIDNQELSELPAPPIIISDSVLVPARAVFERMGGMVGWHAGNRQVTVYHGDDILVMTIDDRTATLNGIPLPMPIPPMIVNDSTMIPLRLPAEAFGFGVDWDATGRAAILNSPYNNGVVTQEPPLQLNQLPELPTVNEEDNFFHDEHPHEEIFMGENKTDVGMMPPPPGQQDQHYSILARDISTMPIPTIAHPLATVTGLRTPSQVGGGAYIIEASAPITGVSHFLLYGNRLVIDIHNASSAIDGPQVVDPLVPISGVRASQFSNDPMIARVVFDVMGAADFSISLSGDRRFVTVSFSPNSITGIMPQSDVSSDTLFITGNILPSVRISTEGYPSFITLNIDNTEMNALGGLFPAGVFASHYTVGQRADGSSYIQLHVGDAWPAFNMTHSANTVAFTLHRGISGVRYDTMLRELRISREGGFTMDVNNVQRINEYLRYRYTIVLPPSAQVLGQGMLSVADGYVNSVTLERDANGNLRMVFDNARVLAFVIEETPTEYIIRARRPRELHPAIVIIDPGHGGDQPGSIHNSVVEKDLVLAISHKVMQLLNANPNIQAFMTRTDDSRVANPRRAQFANELDADMFISIHANAAELRPGVINPAVHGIETWYTISEIEEMSRHSLSSRQLSQIIQRNLIQASGAHDRGLMHGENLVVIRDTAMPSALLELGFLTNPQEAARLNTTQYQWLLAQAIYNGIVEAVGRM